MPLIPQTRIAWKPCYRIISSRFPPLAVYENVADPADLEAVFIVESLTNDRLREEAGDLSLVPPEDRVSGPGTTAIMAAFTHLNAEGDRFTNGTFGVFYAARDIKTAVAETRHRREQFMARTNEPPQDLDMRVYAVDIDATLHDLRTANVSFAEFYSKTDYSQSQALAVKLRESGSGGIVYWSVREPGGECIAVFRPRLLSNCRQERHLCYVWDGKAVTMVYEKKELDPNI